MHPPHTCCQNKPHSRKHRSINYPCKLIEKISFLTLHALESIIHLHRNAYEWHCCSSVYWSSKYLRPARTGVPATAGGKQLCKNKNYILITLSLWSSLIRPLATALVAPLHPTLSLASRLMLLNADGGSARIPLECVQQSLSWSSSLSCSIHSPEHHVIFHPSCSHHVSKVA